MMNPTSTTLAVLAVLTLGACATQQAAPPQLDAARSVVRQAEIDPVVLSSAPLELKKATDSLARADQLLAKGEPLAEVTSVAYVAERQARTAMALADAKRDETSIGAAESERERARADAKEAEARRARLLAADAQARAGAAQTQAELARQQAAEAEQRASSAQQQTVAAQSAAAAAQSAAAAAKQQAAALQQRLADLQAQETERGMLVTLGDVLFEFGRADIKPTAQASLRKLADFLQQYPDRSLLIEGHTDSVGSAQFNEQLSRQRAEAVATALGAMGVAPQRVKVVGYGKNYPIADNNTDTNRALNRRVEVYISRTGEPVRLRG